MNDNCLNNYSQCRNLWAAVIIQAIEDYKKGSLALKRDAVRFFKGNGFNTICEMFDIDPIAFKNNILKRKISHNAFRNKHSTALCFECGKRFKIVEMKKFGYGAYVCSSCVSK